MKIVAVNASPRSGWNTSTLVKEAAKGAASKNAEIQYFDLYQQPSFTGCISCFGCKHPKHLGKCAKQDGLTPVLDAIAQADGLIIGTPNYLGDVSAGFRSLYERLVFQSLTYKKEIKSYQKRSIPVLLIMTSNCAEEFYASLGYDVMIENYRKSLSIWVGPTNAMICGNTLQIKDNSLYQWTLFDQDEKLKRHEEIFPEQMKKAFDLGKEIISFDDK